LSQKAIPHNARVPAQLSFHKKLTEKRKDDCLCHLLAAKKVKNFTMICRKQHMVSSICLRATIFRNPEGTLWTHCTTQYPLKTATDIKEVIAEFTNVIQKAAYSAIPDDKPQTKYSEYPWEVKDQIKEKRKLRRKLQMSNIPKINADTTKRLEN
jgi:hypothetical protein